MSADIAFQVTDTSPTLGRHLADNWPILDRYFTDVSASNWPTLGRWLVDTWSMVSRHWVDSQRIAARYIGRESADGRWMYLSRCLSVCTVFSPLPIGLKKK